ncbi:RIPOR family member 3 isoform X1 [Pygocentrus nattereri]|uniref:RIPOR family member 3 isoform X1 n=2 Tax=Pygocentrus nattereri TaxID=42514 RepID=UPI001891D98E|nr:RIPOR family member 3 isoform X1 [Pygocentrus nattereri]
MMNSRSSLQTLGKLGGEGMSVKLRFDCPAEGGMVQRSRSFTGVNTLSGRRRLSSTRGSLRTKAQAGKSPRIPSSVRMVGGIWGQQPEQVDRIFQALRKGLKEYLEGHQMELDFLSSQQRDTKRNSRLAFFYDLEKEIRALERYIRRLEFQISKVEELYETYCIQWRLCQGAVNMKRAFSLSPSSRASRESLLELSRNHRHSLEDMCAMEGQLEILLGELQIKMKGLIGFARLCPGDQYEVLIRLGRQRWRIRGRIQTDDRQLWDEEEMVFLPHIHENFEIKVTEVKGLSSILVGMVTCKSADFFMTRPQLMVVDITELGTIKLQLEVVWNPFDSGEVKPIVSSASRQSVHSRKGSMYSWTPPNTPSFTEKYFLSMMRQLQDPDGSFSIGSRESRGVSLLSYLSDSAQALTPSAYERAGRLPVTPEPSADTQSVDDDLLKTPLGEVGLVQLQNVGPSPFGVGIQGDESGEWPSEPETSSPSPGGSKRDSIFLFQRYSTPDILRQNGEVATNQEVEAEQSTAPDEVRVEEASAEQEVQEKPQARTGVVGNSQRKAAAVKVSLALAELDATLQEMSYAEDELKQLDLQTRQFYQGLKRDIFPLQTSSSETLAVEEEEVLGSFDFLSTDFSTDDISCMGSVRLRDTGTGLLKENTVKSRGVLAQDTALSSEGQETGEGPQSAESEDRSPLSTGEYTLDQALEVHLNICTALLRALRLSDADHVRQDILEELSRQTEVLEKIDALTHKKTDDISAAELLCDAPKLKNVQMFWEECCESDSSFCCSADSFLRTLRKRFIHKVKAKLPGQADTVFGQLLQQVQSSCRMVPLALCLTDRVSMFQLQVYLGRWKLTDFGEHISHLSREVYLASSLESPKRRRALKKLKGRRISELQPLGRTLQLLAKLLTDANHKVAVTATSCLCRASGFKSFRSKALVHYTWLLRENDTQRQQQACLALKCLKATESAEQVAELWRSADEDLRNAARETVLSFGKKGHAAFQRMDRICSELQEEIYKNLDTEITIF